MQNNSDNLTTLLLVTTFLILLMAGFILTILFLYRKKQIAYQEKLDKIQADYERNLMKSKLEMQELTFQNISREIHDNISLSLTLAKLNLNTLEWKDREKSEIKLNSSIELLGKSIHDLSDISKGLNSDVIIQNGLIKAVEDEVARIRQTGVFNLNFAVVGDPVYMDAQKELIVFRIIQESFNNIIKHAKASLAEMNFHFNNHELYITIGDNGKGFDPDKATSERRAGLKNMETRIKILEGSMHINSRAGRGTTLLFTIPF